MILKTIQFLFFLIIFNSGLVKFVNAEILKEFEVTGNQRISTETIKLFSEVSINQNLNDNSLNEILKKLYNTGFFKNINISFKDNKLSLVVEENPIIENIEYKGIKSKTILKLLLEDKLIKERNSFNEINLKNEKVRLNLILNELGYVNSNVKILVSEKKNNLIKITFDFELGKKAKIKKITFVGNKVFKDRKLRRVIASSEYKFWKIISGKKFLNKNLVELDKRLLKNYYKNNGYYNVKINSSFAKLINENEFELIFNINSGSRVYFGDLKLNLPRDFDEKNFSSINKLLNKIKGEPYSINSIDKILDEIDYVTTMEQFKFINATVTENLNKNKINLNFFIKEGEKFYIEKINIFGNNVTSENVIRNQLEVDEGDPYNELLTNKSINNIKSLNFFKKVNKEVTEGSDTNTKIINISVEEKPTGEISASAGVGTSGGSIGFGIKENNFLGSGVSLDSNISLNSSTIKGKFSVTNPNFNNTDKSVYISAEALETDNSKTFGYKTSKTGVSFGTNFEYLNDFYLGIGTSNFYEKIDTNSTASARQQAQEGNYWDTFLKLDLNYDKRNQKFQASSGFRSFYSVDIPLISDTNTLKNFYSHSYYFNLFEKNISSISLYLETANSIKNKDVKLSERITIPSKRLRGFEAGRVGPKDGDDYIGGNYAYSLNFSSTIPQIFEESQNVDFLFFADAADIWGVDYDSSLDNSEIRSSIGIALDWFSPIGPMNFSLAHPITKADGDKTESFRFNLGTTF
tara:strand:- start:836 stop:3082 length:2247 start_codon:yes stop_codon:yes gene_type:complete